MRRGVSTRYRPIVVSLCVVALVVTRVGAHDTKPPLPPKRVKTEELEPLPWTWLHWWEANRDRYLWQARLHGGGVFVDVAAERKQAIEKSVGALEDATRLDAAELRVAAAVALGRIGRPRCTKRLIELLKDPVSDVRVAAMLALGMALL